SRRATDRRRSSSTLHSFQGTSRSSQRAKSVTYVSGINCDLCLGKVTTPYAQNCLARFKDQVRNWSQPVKSGLLIPCTSKEVLMGKTKLTTSIAAPLLAFAAVPNPAPAQTQNGVVQLQPNETIIIEGPSLGGQSKCFADILAYPHEEKKQHITIKTNSEGSSVNEANFITGAMQTFQRMGGTIQIEVLKHAMCWSICPLVDYTGLKRKKREG
ncbi:MAG: hypothetical protein ACR2PF_10905, partial [Rhizobiaceae bacterium]